MSILVVGSVALDTIRTPSGEATEVLGGSATYFSAAASYFSPVRVVGAIGDDFRLEELDFLRERSVDFKGLQVRRGRTFRWTGKYGLNPNDRETVDLQPGVFSGFQPTIPEEYKDSEYLFLANIDPELQLKVLEQVRAPKLSVCDTIDHWIRNRRESLLEGLDKVDAVVLNDAEVWELTGEPNLIKASKLILRMGPEIAIIKKGEHGALMVTEDSFFTAPAYPVESVCDPTGAGDSFAGGFLGYLAKTGDLSDANLRRAIVYGSVMASFTVETFSLEGLKTLSDTDIQERFLRFKKITHFE